MNFYLEIAKLRAARLLWWRIMTGFGAKNPRSLMLRTHCQTSGWTLTEQDPYNNVVRTTIEAMAAVFGGTQSLHTNALDEAIALPTEFSARIARNTQLILQEETHITSVADPWGGSYMMEPLTQDMADAAWVLIEEVEALGGMTKAVEAAGPSSKSKRRAAKQARIDSGRDTIVGVNKYKPTQEEDRYSRHRQCGGPRDPDPRLQQVRAPRNGAAESQRRSRRCRPRPHRRGQPAASVRRAMRLRATVGEVSDALEKVWGRHRADTQEINGVYAAAYDSAESWADLQGRYR